MLLLGLGCMIGLYAVLPEPSIIPHMTVGSIVGVLAFVAFWIPSVICTKRIERIKHDHDLNSYREISAFMDGREITDGSEALPGRGSRSSFVLKIVCGFGIGFVCAFLITTIANSIL